MNEESKKILKFNGLSLQRLSSQYYRTSRVKSSSFPKKQIFKKNRSVSVSTCYDSKMLSLSNSKLNVNNKAKYGNLNASQSSFRDGIK